MKAAVLHTLGISPHFEDFPDPQPGQDQMIVRVKAASLKNIDKLMASGPHFDIILDYLWGHPTEILLDALTGHDVMAESSGIRLIEIGEMAGPIISLPAAALRSSGIEIYGSGGGSIPHTAIFDAFPKVWALATDGKLRIDIETVPLADVERAWQRNDLSGRRLVIIP